MKNSVEITTSCGDVWEANNIPDRVIRQLKLATKGKVEYPDYVSYHEECEGCIQETIIPKKVLMTSIIVISRHGDDEFDDM